MTDALFDDQPYAVHDNHKGKPRGEKPLHTIISDGSWWAVATRNQMTGLAHRGRMVPSNHGRIFATDCGLQGRRIPIAKGSPVNACPKCLKS